MANRKQLISLALSSISLIVACDQSMQPPGKAGGSAGQGGLEKKLKELEATNGDLNGKLEAANKEAAKAKAQAEEVKKAQTAIGQIEEQLKAEQAAKKEADEAVKTKDATIKAKDETIAELQKAKASLDSAVKEKTAAENKATAIEADRAKLTKLIADIDKALGEKTDADKGKTTDQRVTDLLAARKAAVDQVAALTAAKTTAESDRDAAKAAVDKLVVAVKEISQEEVATAEAAEAVIRNAPRKIEDEVVKPLKDQVAALEVKVNGLEGDKTALTARITALTQTLDEKTRLEAEAVKIREALQTRIQAATTEMAFLNGQMALLQGAQQEQKAASEKKIEELNREIGALQTAKEDLTRTMVGYRDQVQTIVTRVMFTIGQSHPEIKDISATEKVDALIADRSVYTQKVEALQQATEKLTTENAALKAELEANKQTMAELTPRLEKLAEQAERMADNLAAITTVDNQTKAELDVVIQDLAEQIEKARSERLKARLKAVRQRLVMIRSV